MFRRTITIYSFHRTCFAKESASLFLPRWIHERDKIKCWWQTNYFSNNPINFCNRRPCSEGFNQLKQIRFNWWIPLSMQVERASRTAKLSIMDLKSIWYAFLYYKYGIELTLLWILNLFHMRFLWQVNQSCEIYFVISKLSLNNEKRILWKY